MIKTSRRHLIQGMSALALGQLITRPAYSAVKRIVLVHGIAQQGRVPTEIKKEWLDSLAIGAAKSGGKLPPDIKVELPYYGDTLFEFVKKFKMPLLSDITTKGDDTQDDFLEYQARIAEELRQASGITEEEVDAVYGGNPRPKGPQNWEWVQAIIKAIDKHYGEVSKTTIEIFLRDVFLYTRRQTVREVIDAMVAQVFTEEPTLVVGHSLGSVVSYNVLRSHQHKLNVPLFITVGSPLAIRAIRDSITPIRTPRPVKAWFNAYDERDVVALFPLDERNFKVKPPIENFADVKNGTDNRHSISGYLDDKLVASKLLAQC